MCLIIVPILIYCYTYNKSITGGEDMQDMSLYSGKRYLMGILNTLCCCTTHILNLVIAPVIIYIAADFGIDNATAGYASTLHVLAQGIFILISPIMIGWIGNKRTQIIGLTIMIAGALASYFANSFSMLLVCRFITGMGHGVCSGCSNAVIAEWMPAKDKSIFITVNGLAIAAITMLSYTCTVPLFHAVGDSWRVLLLALGIMLVVVNAVWIAFYKDNHALNEYLKKQNALEGRKTNAFSGMREALSRRDVWIYWLFMGFATVGANGINTYLPQFLQNVRGYTDAASSSVIGIASGIGFAATLLGGIVTTALGKRKVLIIPSMLVCILFLSLSLTLGNPVLISAAFIVYSVSTNFRGSAQGTVTTELKNGSPALASSASAVSFGIGFIATSLTSPMLKMSTSLLGAERSMLVFVPLFVISLIFGCMLPETGPGRAKKQA